LASRKHNVSEKLDSKASMSESTSFVCTHVAKASIWAMSDKLSTTTSLSNGGARVA
jgi:hypothetical protein